MKAKRVPNFWWDFEYPDGGGVNTVVESDDPEHPRVSLLAGSRPEEAAALVARLREGRSNHRRLAAELSREGTNR